MRFETNFKHVVTAVLLDISLHARAAPADSCRWHNLSASKERQTNNKRVKEVQGIRHR